MTFTGKTLRLNYRTSSRGVLRVELQDAEGQAIAPYTADKCLLRGDNLSATVAWGDKSDVSQLAGKPIRLRFLLRDAELFSFRFE
jgi:hypothetical protein